MKDIDRNKVNDGHIAADAAEGERLNISRRQLLALSGVGAAALALPTAAGAAKASVPLQPRILSLDTRLTRAYGIRFPLVGAGMGFVALPELVAAISNAGGLGVFGNGIEPPPSTRILIQNIKAATQNPFGIDFIFDESAFGPLTLEEHIDVCVAEQVRLVVFHMNVPPRQWIDKLHASGAKVWMQCASVKQAVEAAAAGMDALIAQGVQAGGHNKSVTPTLTLLPQIVREVQPLIVLASGGIADGASVVRALEAGADGVWVGTRFVASTEAYAHVEYKRRIVEATGDATAISLFQGPEYPNRPIRVLRNRVVNQFAGREREIPNPPPPPEFIGKTVLFPQTLQAPFEMPKFSALPPSPDTVGDFEEMAMPAGSESVRVIKRVQPAARIVAEMMGEAQQIILQSKGLLQE